MPKAQKSPVKHAVPRMLASSRRPKQASTDVVFVSMKGKETLAVSVERYTDLVDSLVGEKQFSGKLGQAVLVRAAGQEGARDVVFVGLGSLSDLREEKLRQAGGSVWNQIVTERLGVPAVYGAGLEGESHHQSVTWLAAFAEGMALAAYRFKKYRTPSKSEVPSPTEVHIVSGEKALQRALDEVMAVAECVSVARDWSNEPSNQGTPEFYAQEARKLGRAHGLKVRVLTEADARREKMGLFLAVGQGSEREGRVVVLEYTPRRGKPRGLKTLALVGKGVTFDSGGISIKPALRMEEMKHDMSGAANVLAATLLAARLGSPNRIISILALTENMPSGHAVQPGNVIRSRAGKMVEIINTDAEGRLILADALDFAQGFKPDAIVDIATLTGAVSIALGKQAAAVLGNNEDLVALTKRCAEGVGERLWQLPLWDEYFEDMRSDTADFKNSCNDGLGGTIRGAMFLKQFIHPGMPWVHLDIAAMANGVTNLSYIPKRGATGLYVRTLARLAMEFSQ